MRTLWSEWCRSVLTAVLTVTLSAAGVTLAQDRISNRNRDFSDVNNLLGRGSDHVPGFGFGNGSSATQVDVSRIDQRALANLLAESIDASEQLYTSLNQDRQRYPSLRTLITELLSIRAMASRISVDMKAGVSLQRLLPQFQQLDSDWRQLSHRLSQTRGLSTTSIDKADRIDRLGRSLEKLFQMDPQIDRRALLTELSQLSSSIRNLVQEMELDSRGGNRLYQLIVDTRKLNQEANRVRDMVMDQYPYTDIVTEYNRFETAWQQIGPEVRALNNRYVDRIIRNVMLADTNIHNLLLLEQQTSRDNLVQIANALNRDVDEFFGRVPLKLLLHFKNVNRILETSDNFYGTVQNFKDCVDRNEDERTLLECYRYVEEYGNDFIQTFQPLRSSQGIVVLREIEDGIVALRNELRLAGTVTSIDSYAMIPTAAALENLADHLEFDVQQWLYRDRQSFRTQALQASARFVKRTQDIHKLLATRPTANEMKTQVSDLIEDWRNVYQYLGRCNTEHREHLRLLSQDISKSIYDLRAPLQM